MSLLLVEGDAVRPKCWVLCRKFGVTSEVWLYRQVLEFRGFEPEVVCWVYENQGQFPPKGFAVRVMPFEVSPSDGPSRWVIRIRNVRHGNFYGSVGAEADALLRALRESSPTVVLAQFGHMALRILPVAIEAGVPVVAHFHGIDVTAGLRNRWYRSSLKSSLRKFAALVVVADYQREQLVALGAHPGNVHVIPCGVPLGALRAANDVGAQPCGFLSVGRFTEKKGPLLVVKAFAECSKAVPDSNLTMIGEGPMLEPARKLALELGVAGKIRFTGAVLSETVLSEMAGASVFVQHSLTASTGDMEGWPVSIAEAMGTGLPVVSTRHAGIVDQVIEGESGFLVAEGDWREMGYRMRSLAQDPVLRVRLARRSAEIAKERFDQKGMVGKLEEILRSAGHEQRTSSTGS